MQRNAILAASIVFLITGLSHVARCTEQTKGYIYDGVGKAKNLSIVIDTYTHGVQLQGTTGARIGTSLSAITHDYTDCGNNAFYCLTGMLEIVIPKAMPVKRWQYHDLSCRSVAQLGGDAYRITCQSPKYHGHPTYTYSLSRGVISIESSPVAGDYRYELRGKFGLFSTGSNP